MAENIYVSTNTITTSEVGPSMQIRLSAVLRMMQDSASVHAERLGLGFDYLSGLKRAFILSRMQVKVCAKLPTWGENVRLTTWPRGVEKLFAYRDFELADKDDVVFLKATTSWLLLDTEIRHPVRPQEFFAGIVTRDDCVMEGDFPCRLGWDRETQPFDTRRARASDLDPNGHVNNTRYVDWITDSIAEQHGLEARIEELSINFMAEIRMSESVRIGIHEEPEGEIVIQGDTDKHSFAAKVLLAK